MLKNITRGLGRSTALKVSAVAGLAVVALSTGIPAAINASYADAVSVQAPPNPDRDSKTHRHVDQIRPDHHVSAPFVVDLAHSLNILAYLGN